ncbi:NAD(P)/FAD-dependent oxidoreductase [Streptomyces sp. CA-111067]|uniref:NAD(P)/FAD-dependent oxidoreductase n=1 Tax=Streptomyces sp. CA-111067 TaxID=3240046 RepID=UPI003D96D3BF
MDKTDRKHVVILGGGYTGLLCAILLSRKARRTGAVITLVNPAERFSERLRSHQIAVGQELADCRIPAMLDGTGVRFVQGRAVAVDPAGRRVLVQGVKGNTEYDYDNLVYALGSTADTSAVPGAEQHAWTLDDPRRAHEMAGRLAELAATGGNVVVCGAGLTGVEAAAEIAESHPALRVTLVSREQPGALMGGKARAYLHRSLDRLGVAVRSGVEIAEVLPEKVRLAGGELLAADLCLWTAGVRVAPLAAESGIATDARGQVLVDGALRSVSHPEVYAIGDAAAVRQPWGVLHGTCQSGMPTAEHAADTIARELRGRPAEPFRFGYVHQPVCIGRRDAVIQFTRADDTPRRAYLTGRLAVTYKNVVSGSPIPVYRISKRVAVSIALFRGGRATRGATTAAPQLATPCPEGRGAASMIR